MSTFDNQLSGIHLYEFEDFLLDTKRVDGERLLRSGKPFPLRNMEFSLLCVLVENHGREVCSKELYKGLWDENSLGDQGIQNRLQRQVTNLRKRIGEEKIATTQNGYSFVAEVKEIPSQDENSEENSADKSDLEFGTWILKDRQGRTLSISFGIGIATTILYLIAYYLYFERFKHPLLSPTVVLSLIQAIMMIYALITSFSIFDHLKKDFRTDEILDTTVMKACGYDDPEEWKKAKSRAKDALKEYVKFWKSLFIIWGCLYSILFFTNLLNQRELNAGWLSYGLNISGTLLNNLNSLVITLSFIALNNPTIVPRAEPDSSPAQLINRVKKIGGIGIILFALIELFLVLFSKKGFESEINNNYGILILDGFSGLIGGIALVLYCGRLQSKFLSRSLSLSTWFALYAVIQPLFLLIKGIGHSDLGIAVSPFIMEAALILKCLLYIFVAWLFESGRLLFYFVRVKPLYEKVDSDWKDFYFLLGKAP